METTGNYLFVRPPLGQRVAVKSCVFVAGVVLMLARTSPVLAADNHGTNKGANKTNAAVVQRSDSPPAKTDHQIGGGGDGKGDGKNKTSGDGGANASAAAQANAKADAKAMVDA